MLAKQTISAGPGLRLTRTPSVRLRVSSSFRSRAVSTAGVLLASVTLGATSGSVTAAVRPLQHAHELGDWQRALILSHLSDHQLRSATAL